MDIVVYVFPIVGPVAFVRLLYILNKTRVGKNITMADLLVLCVFGLATTTCIYTVMIKVSLIR